MKHYIYFRGKLSGGFATVTGCPSDEEAVRFAVKKWGVHLDYVCNEAENEMRVKDKKIKLIGEFEYGV